MKGGALSYKIVGLMFVLLLSGTTLSGAEYRGDQSISPFMRFLRGLFWGGSGTTTHFDHRSQGQTYQFSSLSIGSSKTGASSATGSASQQDIWAGYGKDITSSPSGGTARSGGSRSFNRTNNSAVGANSQQTDGYMSSLTTSAATSNTLASSTTSSSSSAADAVAAPMPSVLTMQRASSQLAMTTMTTTVTQNNSGIQPPVDTGFGTNGNGAADPTIQTPVGDGSWELLFLLSLYVYFKRKRFFGTVFHA
jgi:hypothetical protein